MHIFGFGLPDAKRKPNVNNNQSASKKIDQKSVQKFLQDFSKRLTNVRSQNKVEQHYNTLVETMYQWKNNDITLEPVADLLKTPFINDAQKSYYIGDIHGDLNHLLLSLTQSGLATIDDPPIAFFDVNKDQKISFELAQNMSSEDLKRLLPIPNLTFNKDCDAEVIVLGDILDRGEYMDQCLHILLDLARQEKIVSPDSNKLKIVFGDHELYGFTLKLFFTPSYNLDPGYRGPLPNNSNEIFGLFSPQHSINKTSVSLNKAFQEGLIRYTWIGSHGECCTHSTFTETFIKDMLVTAKPVSKFLSSINMSFNSKNSFPKIFKSIEKGGAGVDRSKFEDYCNELLQGNNNNISPFVNMLNQTFVWLAKNVNTNKQKILTHPMLNASSPIWSRAKGLHHGNDSDWLKIPGVIGHTDSKEGHIQCLNDRQGTNVIFDVDVGASGWYREDGKSRARLIMLENGMISHQRIKGEDV